MSDGPREVPLPHAAAPDRPPRLLANRRFLLLVVADGLASLGRWGFFLAVVGDATYRLRADPGEVAMLLAAFSLPYILTSPLHGMAADRWSAKWLLAWTVLASSLIPLIPLTTDSLGALYLAAGAFGALNAAVIPARGALVPRLVPKDRLVQANGTISAALALQLVIGPTLAATLAGLLGRDAPYFVTAAAAVISFLTALGVPDRRAVRRDGAGGSGGLVDGFREGLGVPVMRSLFLLAVSVWFLIGLLISLEPAYIREYLGRGQVFLGVVWAVYGGGELIGSVVLARMRKGVGREPTLVAIGLLMAAVGFLIYVSIPDPVAVIAGNVVFGIGFPLFTATSGALVQRLARNPGQVSAAFSITAEIGPVSAALVLTAMGDLVAPRGLLFASSIVFGLVALVALVVARRARLATAPTEGGT